MSMNTSLPHPPPVTEAQLQYTMTTKNTVLRAHLLLAGAMGPMEVLRYFQDRFIMESISLMKKGYSLGSGQDHVCNHAIFFISQMSIRHKRTKFRFRLFFRQVCANLARAYNHTLYTPCKMYITHILIRSI